MNCKETTDKLLDMVEGDLPEDATRRVRQHLEDCPQCRDEAECMRAGLNGVKEAVPLQVGSGPHLTPCRKEAILRDAQDEARVTRLFTARRFAAAAAAAMLLVSAWFLAQDFLGPAPRPRPNRSPRTARELPSAQDSPRVAGRTVPTDAETVRVTDQGTQERARRVIALKTSQRRPRELLYSQPRNLQIPVQNARYQPSRERYWW